MNQGRAGCFYLYLVRPSQTICDSCRSGNHLACEDLAVREDGALRTACQCLCLPEWMQRSYDSSLKGERR